MLLLLLMMLSSGKDPLDDVLLPERLHLKSFR
jgi:hypothetical protein